MGFVHQRRPRGLGWRGMANLRRHRAPTTADALREIKRRDRPNRALACAETTRKGIALGEVGRRLRLGAAWLGARRRGRRAGRRNGAVVAALQAEAAAGLHLEARPQFDVARRDAAAVADAGRAGGGRKCGQRADELVARRVLRRACNCRTRPSRPRAAPKPARPCRSSRRRPPGARRTARSAPEPRSSFDPLTFACRATVRATSVWRSARRRATCSLTHLWAQNAICGRRILTAASRTSDRRKGCRCSARSRRSRACDRAPAPR